MFEQIQTAFMSSRRNFIKLNLLATMALLTGCQDAESSSLSNTTTQQPVSLDVKIGQMLLVGFRGFSVNPSAPIVQDIQQRHIGGVILFDYDVAHKKRERNIQSPAQVKALVKALQGDAKIPLLVAIDY